MADSSDSPKPAADPLIGRQIRDLRIVERIGQGGMGAVYKAEHVLLQEPRALKVMRTELFRSIPNAVERFEREARIAVKLRHPNLVLLYDFFVHEDSHFLVMEYVTGTSLAAFLREHGALSVEGACRIGIQCCAGLAYAHEMGIVHRDLSPENIMLASSPAGVSVKIIDFGVARAAFAARGQGLQVDRTLTQIGEFIGKPRYASPEQAGALRRGETLDHRSDLYTLGLILYEMTTGHVPFTADTAFDYLSHHVHTPPPRPSKAAPALEIPAALEQVILRCLAKKREDRYASARELGAALEAAWRGEETTAVRAPAGSSPSSSQRARTGLERARLRARRRRLVPAAAAAALAAIALAGAGFWWARSGESTAQPEPAVVAVAEPEAAPAPEPEPVPAPAVEPQVPEPPAPEPRAEPTSEPAPAPRVEQPKPAPARAPAPAPAPAPAVAFADASEMQRAFDTAVEYEKAHSAQLAIENWKKFRARTPSRELDEQAKRRITALTLGNLPGL
jgi:serine/threonine-protein kinase